MSDLRTAAQQALEAMDELHRTGDTQVFDLCHRETTEALRAALEQPVQEPVAWIHTDPDKPRVKFLEWREDEPGYRGRWIKTPVYTAPPQRKPLTEEEIEKAYREIWRDLPTDFDHTSSGWIEQGIKYAERAHGIGGQDES